MLKKKTRFAPSPSGSLHIGGARTAIFNKVEAVRRNGLFVLRFEDTDQKRSSSASIDNIVREMKWLGITWDEGPGVPGCEDYFQSKRLGMYSRLVHNMINNGSAYPCFCGITEKNRGVRYNGKCRNINYDDAKKMMQNNKYCVRIKNYPRVVEFKDIVIDKKIKFDTEEYDDFVLFRSNGYPVYNFSCAVDDHSMDITHVLRGSDHIPNTPKQIMIFESFGWNVPEFGHLPLILDKSTKKKMSKRDNGVSVSEYINMGLSPRAVNAYLMSLGFNLKRPKEYSINEFAKKFDTTKIKNSPSFHDLNRLKKTEDIVDKAVGSEKWKPNVG